MTKAIAQTYSTVHTYRVLIVRALFAGCMMAVAWYGVNLYTAISRTIAAESVSKQADALGTQVSQLDVQYIKLANAASPSALSSYGMTVSPVSAYIPRTISLGVALSGHEF